MGIKPGDIVQFRSAETGPGWAQGLVLEIRSNPADIDQVRRWKSRGETIPAAWPRRIVDVLHEGKVQTCWFHFTRVP